MSCFPEPLICWIFLVALGQNIAFGVTTPILSLQFLEDGIPAVSIGVVFATYAVAIIVWSNIASYLLTFISGKRMIAAGMMLMGVVFVLYSFIG